LTNIGATDAVIGGDLSMQSGVLFDGTNLLVRKLCAAVGFPPCSFSLHSLAVVLCRDTTPSSNPISSVLCVRAPAKMVRVHARWIVARMQSKMSTGARPAIQQQANMRCQHWDRASVFPVSEPSIASPVPTSHPRPADFWRTFGDLFPKALIQLCRNFWQTDISHDRTPNAVIGQGRALCNQRFRPVFDSRFTLRSQGLAR